MYVSAWPSERSLRSASPSRQRADGRVAFSAEVFDGSTRPMRIAESGSMRIRLPNARGATLEGVLVNTAGGIACGDRFKIEIDVSRGAAVTIATPAAEKVYRSDGAVSNVVVDFRIADAARLEWLPQETILFDRARLERRFDVAMADDASLMVFEGIVFGRAARGEEVRQGSFEDRWRITRGGRLVYADTLKLDGPIAALLQKPAIANGARALATFLYVAPDAEVRLEEARGCLSQDAGLEMAASAWNGILAVRFCAADISTLRNAAMRFLISFRGTPLPRVWLS